MHYSGCGGIFGLVLWCYIRTRTYTNFAPYAPHLRCHSADYGREPSAARCNRSRRRHAGAGAEEYYAIEAYGSDTEKARQVLLDAAADHPGVLDDPTPMATFEQFADSSLNLVLRAYLPDLDNRMGTITDLHTEISQRFAAAGIEIAFPQRDVHIRKGSESAITDASRGLADSQVARSEGSQRSIDK
jgi:hypothetical protein